MILCCGLLSSISARNRATNATPTQKEIIIGATIGTIRTHTPSGTNTPEPSRTPAATRTRAPTRTPRPTADPYITEARKKFLDYTEAYMNVNDYVQQMASDPSLIFDNNWKRKTGLALGVLNLRADELAKLEPTPKYEIFQDYLIQLATETRLMTDSFATGVDNLDSNSIERSTQHLTNMTAIMNVAADELERVANNP